MVLFFFFFADHSATDFTYIKLAELRQDLSRTFRWAVWWSVANACYLVWLIRFIKHFSITLLYYASVSELFMVYNVYLVRIFWQTWLHIWRIKKNRRFVNVPCNTLTHSTNEDLLNIKRKGDPEVSYPLSYVRYHWNPEPVCNKSHFVSLFYLYWYFLIY
jgi:hypothetical protein